jgi:hypothetical protein
MEFKGQYLTYAEYRDLGGTLDITPFNLLEFEARRKIDIETQSRLKGTNSQDVPQEVKLCVYSLINAIDHYTESIESATQNGNIASEQTDGYSVSYVKSSSIKDIINSKSVELDDIIRTYLLNVVFKNEHLMYLGSKMGDPECLSTAE